MACTAVFDARHTDSGLKLQTAADAFETGAPFDVILTTQLTAEFPDAEAIAADVGSDKGGPTAARRHSRGGNLNVGAHFRYHGGNANSEIERVAFRDAAWAPETTVIGSGATGDLQYLTAGTHNDSSTGLQIKAPYDSLVALKSGAGHGLTVLMTGWANAENNQPFQVKEIWDDGSTADYVDIYAGYGGASIGSPFGAPKTAEDSATSELHFGSWIRNRESGTGARECFSVMIDRPNLTDERRFRGLVGWVPSDWTMTIEEASVMADVTGIGSYWLPYAALPPNGEAIGDHFNPFTFPEIMIGKEDLWLLGLVTFPSRYTAQEIAIPLTGTFVRTFNFSLTGNVSGLTDILGKPGVSPSRSPHTFAASMDYYIADEEILVPITELGGQNTNQPGAYHVVFRDLNGDYKGLTLPLVTFSQTGGTGGTDKEAGTLAMTPYARDPQRRTAILQEWSSF